MTAQADSAAELIRWPFADDPDPRYQAARKSWLEGNAWAAHERLPESFPDCVSCPLSENGRPGNPVVGIGPRAPSWIALGMEPGQQELRAGVPFYGASGRMLDRVLKSIGTDRTNIWIDNARACLVPGATGSELAKASAACRPRVLDVARHLEGRPVLTLGAAAAQTALNNTEFSINEMAGALFDVDLGGDRAVIPTHHPARILRGGDGNAKSSRAVDLLYWNLVYDAGKVAALGAGLPVRFTYDIETEIESPARALALLEGIAADAYRLNQLSIDTETTGKEARKVKLTALGLGTNERAISIAYHLCDKRVWALFRELCAAEAIRKLYFNRQFDEIVLLSHGVVLGGPGEDVMLQHHAAFPGLPHDLQRVATQFFAIRPWKAEFRHGEGPLDELTFYNAVDTLTAARLYPLLNDCIARTHTEKCYAIDNAKACVAREMQRVGIPIDRKRNRELAVELQAVMARTRAIVEERANIPELRERWLDKLAVQAARTKRKSDQSDFLLRHASRLAEFRDGIRGKKGQILKGKGPKFFKISNSDHVIAYLQARGDCWWGKTTKTGRTAGDKDVLETLTHIEDVRLILEYRDAAKSYSTFVKLRSDYEAEERTRQAEIDAGRRKPRKVKAGKKAKKEKLRGMPLEADGRVYPKWNVYMITGRWSSEPNWQNVSRGRVKKPHQEAAGKFVPTRPNLRTQVVAPPGRTFVYCDGSQLEARNIGLLSGDEFLCSIFLGAADCTACAEVQRRKPGKYCPQHDVHTVFACEVWPGYLDWDADLKEELRDLIKRGEYGGFYGGELDTLYASIVKEFPHVTKEQVARILTVINRKMPGVARWHQQLIRDAMRDGCIRSLITGRPRWFPCGNIDMNVLRNHQPQALGADIVDQGTIKLAAALPPRSFIILQGHDSLISENDLWQAQEVAGITERCMTTSVTHNGITMPYPFVPKIDTCWGNF
jgi:uracil-DNA glycosylase family 4